MLPLEKVVGLEVVGETVEDPRIVEGLEMDIVSHDVRKFPELALVVLIGPFGSGKSSFAREHFKTTEVLSSNHCRRLVSDDENAQAAPTDAFELLHFSGGKRLAAGKLTVVGATKQQHFVGHHTS